MLDCDCFAYYIRAPLKLFSSLITLIVLQAKTLKAWQLEARRLVVDSLNLRRVVVCLTDLAVAKFVCAATFTVRRKTQMG